MTEIQVQALATTAEVAEFLQVDPATVKSWRKRGKGPQFITIEGSVRYRWGEIDAWVEQNSKGVRAHADEH